MSNSGPTMVRRQLGRRLRELRRTARKAEADVEEANLASRAKLWRIETGKVSVKVGDLRSLCWLYGAEEWADSLAALAVASNQDAYWEDHCRLRRRPWLYTGFESIADEIRIYEPNAVPDLLQTPDYRRELRIAVDADEAESHRERADEQQEAILNRSSPPRLTVVLDAGVLGRLVGSRAVMAEQISHLRTLNRRDHVDIRALSQDLAVHPAMRVGAFTILDFSHEDDPAVVHTETLTGARFTERPDEVREYRRIFRQIYERAVDSGRGRL